MERIKSLNRYQKFILILSAVLIVVFAALYAVTASRVGFEYNGKILVPREENGNTVYEHKDAVITVTSDKAVTVRSGGRVYGPYTAREDPGAVPADHVLAEYMTGVMIMEGEEVFFRGGVYPGSDGLILANADGSSMGFTITMSDGTTTDGNGNIVDPAKPTAYTILTLMDEPQLTSKGEWIAWAMGAFICVITAVSILFADELFYMSICFRVQNAENAEPSDLQIAGRYISWTLMPVFALWVFILGCM